MRHVYARESVRDCGKANLSTPAARILRHFGPPNVVFRT